MDRFLLLGTCGVIYKLGIVWLDSGHDIRLNEVILIKGSLGMLTVVVLFHRHHRGHVQFANGTLKHGFWDHSSSHSFLTATFFALIGPMRISLALQFSLGVFRWLRFTTHW